MKTSNKKMYIIIVGIFVIIGAYVIFKYNINSAFEPNYTLKDYYVVPKKEVQVNEYNVVTVSKEQLANTYFSTFNNMIVTNISSAYSKLNTEYRQKKFPTIESFNEYINTITNNYLNMPKMKSYVYSKVGDKTVIKIRDMSNNLYIFSTSGIMVYDIYLDEDAVEIK